MSVNYTTRVFYGTYVPRRSVVGRRLEKWIAEHGGSPAPTTTNGVVIDTAGDDESPLLTIEYGNNEKWSRDRGESYADFEVPSLIPSAPLYWTNWIREFVAINKLPTENIPEIGFYVVGTVS